MWWREVFAAILLGVASLGGVMAEVSPEDFIARFDRNNDGKLSREELPPILAENFSRIDSNADGVLDVGEIAAFRQRVMEAARAPAQPFRGPQVPDSVEATWDIPYAGTDHPRQRLDLLLPKNRSADKPLPVIVAIHGGAWLGGDKRQVIGRLIPLVASGRYAGVSVGYRLSQDAIWPAQIHDCKAAIRWIRGNAKKYNLDPEKIGAIGWSAGGHLVAMLGTAGDVPELEGKLGEYAGESSRVSCVVNFFGPTDFLTIGDYPSQIQHYSADAPEARLLGGPIPDNREKARSASPITFVSADDPPFLMIHGTEDPLVPHQQSVVLKEALAKVGVPAAVITVQDGGHGGFRNPEIERIVDAFFEAHLLGVPHEFADKTLPNSQQ